jgi:AraC-like DNA-binding protein
LFTLFNLHGIILSNPKYFRQLRCGETLISLYNCPLEKKFEDAWSKHNYIVYVMEGRKIWHTAHGSYDLRKDSCVFVRKGACIVEQFFDTAFCVVMFFLPDEFMCEVLQKKQIPLYAPGRNFDPIMPIDNDAAVQGFFSSMLPHFDAGREPDQSLLELKFRELILTIADNPRNAGLRAYFCSLLQEPQSVSLQRIMEENFCFNLKLEQFAQLCNRSLSAFKRDFQKIFDTTPGKWLTEKRLQHAMHLLTNMDKTVSEAAFESGFENPSHFSRIFRERFGRAPGVVKQPIKA